MLHMPIHKTVTASVVGRPNVGKSTLINALAGQKVAIVSKKPQTTRTRITAVVNHDECQYIFLDTPGLHRPKSRLGEYMVRVVNSTVADVDAAVLMVEPVPEPGEPEKALIERIVCLGVPSILLINKIDTVKPQELLKVMSAYGKLHDFDAVIPVSAAKNEGTDILLTELARFAEEGPPLFPEDIVSDQPERQVAAEIIREKLLNLLDREVPHGVAVAIERFSERESGLIEIEATVFCEKESHKGIIIGKNGDMLKRTGERARADLEEFFGEKVFLKLWVKVKEGWRDNDFLVRNFGYDDR